MQDIEKFIRGFGRFQQQYLNEPTALDNLKSGQHPGTLLIGCCDSRVDPALLTGSDPGDIFVVRNIANLVPPCTPDAPPGVSSAIEFAVCALAVSRIIVLGHARCGGIRAFADDSQGPLSPGDFIGKWITLIGPAAQRTGGRGRNEGLDGYVERLALASIQQSLANLRTFPCVQILESKGKLHLHGAYFAVATGDLMLLDPATGQFVPAVGEMPKKVQMIRCDSPPAE